MTNFQKHPKRPYGPYEANLSLIGLQDAHRSRLWRTGITETLLGKLAANPTQERFVLGTTGRFLVYRELSPLSPDERTVGVLLDTQMPEGGRKSGFCSSQVKFPALIEAPDSVVRYNTYTDGQAAEVKEMVTQLEAWERQDRLPGINAELTHIPLVIGEPDPPRPRRAS